MTDTQVLVAGAGPTGLMLAAELALRGVACRVVEQRAQESNLTRAFGVHARTLEQLDMRGLADPLVTQGIQVAEIRPTFGRASVRLPMRHPESRFPYVLIVAQARTEAMLTERARALGVEIVRGAKVVDVREDGDGVEATIEGADGTRTERAGYVVGCDGAHSQVRRSMGVGFSGSTYATHILLADLRLADADVMAVRTFVGRDGMVLMPPFGDGWVRAVIWDRRRQDVPLDEPLGIEEVAASLNRLAGHDLGVREMRWSTRFRSERRQADAYRKGRVFLAGDAAHVHSPLGALGMNTGIQDAMNLGWKIAAAVHGWAAPWLLDSYHPERHPVGAAALRLTDLLQRISVAPAPIRAIRPFLARGALAIPAISDTLRRRVAGLSIAYPPQDPGHAHAWEGRRVADAPLSTGRLYEALRPGRFLLVQRGDTKPLDTGDRADRLDTARLAETADSAIPAVMLVRPDGYVAWAADEGTKDHPDEVRTALSRWCGPAHNHTPTT
ncbi:2-polyprenyl-6-methoxyphenol hydroxylase [Nonomuraea solani]|uniref:2-polyprenyl-6-methoxyphenol hydroxylase n=1 Tax=Nonomuraea solani TaxID=1144553 RepID=A0A1H5YBX5_9ACTN|nr:FAD-dependent monooxygenase [Nonomuraea solani]SEG21474.1 2-polyprenyl-6-methoxyphenol hydroxylase [Nonomuraea solani]